MFQFYVNYGKNSKTNDCSRNILCSTYWPETKIFHGVNIAKTVLIIKVLRKLCISSSQGEIFSHF